MYEIHMIFNKKNKWCEWRPYTKICAECKWQILMIHEQFESNIKYWSKLINIPWYTLQKDIGTLVIYIYMQVTTSSKTIIGFIKRQN